MRLIVLSPADLPVVRLHGFCAIGVVLLGEEVLLVGGDLHEVGFAGLDHAGYHHELRTVLELFVRQWGGTLVAIRIEGVQTLTIGVSGRGGAVGGNEIVAVVVTILFFRSFQGSADGLNTRGAYFH